MSGVLSWIARHDPLGSVPATIGLAPAIITRAGVAEFATRREYHVGMRWSSRFESHPQFGQAVRFATGRPPWVLKATGLVAVFVFLVPLLALALLMLAALLITGLAWVVFSAIARVIDAATGQGSSIDPSMHAPPGGDGRENVRIVDRS